MLVKAVSRIRASVWGRNTGAVHALMLPQAAGAAAAALALEAAEAGGGMSPCGPEREYSSDCCP